MGWFKCYLCNFGPDIKQWLENWTSVGLELYQNLDCWAKSQYWSDHLNTKHLIGQILNVFKFKSSSFHMIGLYVAVS